MTVMATTSILFVMATTLMMIVGYQQQATAMRVGRVRAMHVADAGINAYLYKLRNEYSTYLSNLDTGWVTVSGVEKYRVLAVPPTIDAPLTLYSTGVAGDGTQTIAATVRFPTFGDYMFLSGASLIVAGDANVDGQVRSNGSIESQGHITGKVTAGGTVTGNGRFDRGYVENQPIVDFNQVLATMDDIRTVAGDSSTYFPASGALGYRVVVNGASVVVDKVTGGVSTGNLVTEPVGSFTIPASGVAYFADDVWIEGSYSAPITFVAEGDIFIIGDYAPSDPTSTATSGLIARDNIIVPSWFRGVHETMSINAALLAQSGRIYADIKQGLIRERINVTGSLSYFNSGGVFGTVDKFTGQPVSGFRQNDYTYDQRLNLYPPPMYPMIRDGSLKIDTWVEDRTPAW
jgi:hypothetical protein